MAADLTLAPVLEALAKVARGDLRAAVDVPSDADESVKALSEGVNRLIADLRAAELRARKLKRALDEQMARSEAQDITIRELATPILQIWQETLLLPLVGKLDEARNADITNELLQEIVATEARHVIIDVTGTEIVDERSAEHLVGLVRATNLLGARCVVTGISPSVAQAFVSLGADLSAIRTLRTLERGLVDCISAAET